MKKTPIDILSPDELEKIYKNDQYTEYPEEKILHDALYNFKSLKSAPFFGEETLGIYIRIMEKLAEKNFAPAMYQLGLFYYNGEWWQEQDLEKSVHYHTQAATLGNADAMFELYVLYSTGQGVKKDNEVAVAWCRKAAELGQLRACYNMGAFYAIGRDVEASVEKSMEWYEKASRGGHGKASATLGVMYYRGDEVTEDKEKADKYFDLSIEQGFDVGSFLEMLGIELE